MRRRILLLNPPAARAVARDFYLSAELEPGFLPPPQDLVTLSGVVSEAGEVSVLDCVADGLSAPQAVSRARALSPDAVLFLLSSASYAEDGAFLTGLKAALPRARFIGTGDVYREIKEMAFSLHPFLDAALLDFSASDAALACLQDPGGRSCENVIYRLEDRIVSGPRRHRYGPWDPPLPRWELFPLAKYSLPFGGDGPCASLLTEFGCPFLCAYCPVSSLGHRPRPLERVIEEAAVLKGLGVRRLIVGDQTFASHRARAEAFLKRLAAEKLGLSWIAQTRVDAVDAELLARMREAGCAAVSFGIDSLDDETLRTYKKNTTLAQTREALDLTRKAGLKAWGTIVVGLSLDTRETLEATLRLARELPLDRLSYRLEAQRYAVDYRREMLVRGLVPPEAMPPDTPTTTSVWQGRLGISNPDALEYYRRAVSGAKPASDRKVHARAAR